MMTAKSSKLFQGLGASSSSMEADYLTLSVENVQGIARLVGSGVQLNERQCRDLSLKLVKMVDNIQKLVPPSETGPALTVPFGPALKNLCRVSEKAKLLVNQCCDTDWCKAAVFQIHNEEAFREVLLEVGLCYNVIYELAKGMLGDWEWTLIPAEDFRQSSLFLPASESEVLEDQETLKRGLEHMVGTSDDRNQFLAGYLLGKLKCTSAERMNEHLGMPDALLWVNETEPQGTWKLQRVLGSGSGASCVCCYEWLDIPCARKEFHCNVGDDIFRREAAILARLNHPNIVKFFCCSNGPEKGQCYIAMELMEMSLHDLVERQGRARQVLPILVVLDIITQIARGVCYLHDLKIAHRDLKPLNVVVTRISTAHLNDNFCVKLVDFGMSKTKVQVSKSSTISIPGVGTTRYRAPEVFPQAHQGVKRKVNWFQADAYSFAVTCAVLLSLKSPFEDVVGSKLYEELLRGRRPELPGGCPKELAALLKECWATDPKLRPGFGGICSRLEKCKFQEVLRGLSTSQSAGVGQLLGYEYIEIALKTQCVVRSQCATTISRGGNETEKKVGLWSRAKSSFAQISVGAALFKDTTDKQIRLQFEQTCKDFELKPIMFSYKELRTATLDFHKDMRLRHSWIGSEYKGVLLNGNVVVVKQVDIKRAGGLDAFLNEVVVITGIKHRNLVTVEGCCLRGDHALLVFEYVGDFDLGKILFGSRRDMMTWPMRQKICLGIGRGLHYLHAMAHPRVIHRDIKPSNVLLDKNLEPKISDFCLAVLFLDEEWPTKTAEPAGTVGTWIRTSSHMGN